MLSPDHYLFRMLYSQGIDLARFGVPSRDGIVDPMFGERGVLAGHWPPSERDRALLDQALTAFDRRS
ncbi:hypothetical protein [Sphingomonas sp.]|uniref:hypothetical protein n=1 Tax=Sphingomonas sp. TaxID=28214 RepID=UPI003D6D9F53